MQYQPGVTAPMKGTKHVFSSKKKRRGRIDGMVIALTEVSAQATQRGLLNPTNQLF